MTDTPKRKRGRPRKDPLASVTSAQLVFTHPYTTNGSYWRTAPVIAKELREFAAKYAQQPMAKNLADWIDGIAKCVEAGNAVEAGFCGLTALKELAELVGEHIEPFAREGQRKLAADKRKGRRSKVEVRATARSR